MEIEERIAELSSAINKQTVKLARAKYRENTNAWLFADGSYAALIDPNYLKNKVEDEKKKLNDMLWQLDRLVEERDEHTSA